MKIFTNCLFRLPGPSKDVKPVIKKEPTSATSTFKPKLETKKPSPKKVSPSKTNIKKGIIHVEQYTFFSYKKYTFFMVLGT